MPTPPPHEPAQARAAALTVVRTLRDAGHTAYFAGGCVRDELLGLHPADYDVATSATPEAVKPLFRRTNHVGAAFGVTLVHIPVFRAEPGSPLITVEVATFRSDGPYADKRRPDSVAFADAPADAARRDFTVNALFLDPLAPPDPATPAQGRVIDYVGGVADLRARVIRAVGDPAARLDEDHLRALRAARFAARLGFTIEPATAHAIRAHAARLAGVSRERVGDELRRMLTHPARLDAATLVQALGLDAPVLGDHRPGAPLPTLAALAEPTPLGPGDVFPVALAAWSIDRAAAGRPGATPDRATPALVNTPAIDALAGLLRTNLCLSNAETGALRACLTLRLRLMGDWHTQPVASQKRAAHDPAFVPALVLVQATLPQCAARAMERLSELGLSFPPGPLPEPLVTGDDLVGIGLEPGPRFKALLERLLDAQLEGRTRTKAEAMELARSLSV